MMTEAEKDDPVTKKSKLPPETLERYRKAGQYLQKLRLRDDLTQLDISKKVGLEQPAIVSHVETGRARVPAEKIPKWASAFPSADPREVAQRLLFFYDPPMWQTLFGSLKKSSSTSRRKGAASGS